MTTTASKNLQNQYYIWKNQFSQTEKEKVAVT